MEENIKTNELFERRNENDVSSKNATEEQVRVNGTPNSIVNRAYGRSTFKNEVTLSGRIETCVANSKCGIIVLSTRSSAVYANFPKIHFFGPEGAEKVKKFSVGERVQIFGMIQSYERLKPNQLPVLIAGNEIVPEEEPAQISQHANMDSPIESFAADINKFEICGIITGIDFKYGREVFITIKTVVRGRWTTVKYPYLVRDKRTFLPKIYVSQFVRALGTVQTVNVPVYGHIEETEEEKVRSVESAKSIGDIHIPLDFKTKQQQRYVLYDVFVQ